MGTSNLVPGTYRAGEVVLDCGPRSRSAARTASPTAAASASSIRPEKIWLSDFEPGMAW